MTGLVLDRMPAGGGPDPSRRVPAGTPASGGPTRGGARAGDFAEQLRQATPSPAAPGTGGVQEALRAPGVAGSDAAASGEDVPGEDAWGAGVPAAPVIAPGAVASAQGSSVRFDPSRTPARRLGGQESGQDATRGAEGVHAPGGPDTRAEEHGTVASGVARVDVPQAGLAEPGAGQPPATPSAPWPSEAVRPGATSPVGSTSASTVPAAASATRSPNGGPTTPSSVAPGAGPAAAQGAAPSTASGAHPTTTPTTTPGTAPTTAPSQWSGTPPVVSIPVGAPAAPATALVGADAAPTPAPAVRAWTVQQLTTPVVQAAGRAVALPDGTHLATIRISPESLGPVTLEAMARDGVVRLEISAATEAGRENLRAVLAELRRELAATGGGVTLDLAGGREHPGGRDPHFGPGPGPGPGQGAGQGTGTGAGSTAGTGSGARDQADGHAGRGSAGVGADTAELTGPGGGATSGPGDPGRGLDVYA